MVQKLVSICIPTYQQTGFLKKCLDSVFKQTYTNYEVIITDDTPDETVKQFVEKNYKDKRLQYYKNQRALGSPANWNYAVSKAKGDYIKILHHDDYFSTANSLEKFVHVLDTAPKVDFVFSLSTVQDSKTGLTHTTQVSSEMMNALEQNPTELIPGNFIGSPSATLYRRNDLKYDEKLKWVVDIDFYISSLLKNNKPRFINEALITTTNEAAHQVTYQCLGRPEVEVFEFCYLVDKYHQQLSPSKHIKELFLNLFYNYEIKTLNDVKKYYKQADRQKSFYEEVFKSQVFYNFKRKNFKKLKAIVRKISKK